MHIELSEILTCPDCRSPQGLVVLVEELDDEGRVRRGDLGCSRCQRRYPVREGVVDLTAGTDAGEADHGGGFRDAGPDGGAGPDGTLPPADELTVEVGGLLDLPSLRGPVVLGHGLARAAPRLAELADRARILALAGDGEALPAGSGDVTWVRAPEGRLPLLPGKAAGIALWRPGPGEAGDAREALGPGARLAALRPDPTLRRELEGSDLEVLASEERAVVVRRSG